MVASRSAKKAEAAKAEQEAQKQVETPAAEEVIEESNAGKKRDCPDEATPADDSVISPAKKQATEGEAVEEKKDETAEKVVDMAEEKSEEKSKEKSEEKPEEEEVAKPVPSEEAANKIEEPLENGTSTEVAVEQ